MNIVLIGSGNVAHHLGSGFYRAGHTIIQVYSPTQSNAQALAERLNTHATDVLSEVRLDGDLYVLAVRDQDLSALIAQLPTDLQGIVVHTSGATPIDLLSKWLRYGVIYPPQSLSKSVETNLAEIPFALEGNDQLTLNTLLDLMLAIAPKSITADSEQRMALHISAVFANNFSNALFQIAFQLLQTQGLSPELIRPIILETARKVQQHAPQDVQTGPASRNDRQTIDRHLNYLKSESDWREIYQLMSDFIGKKQF